MLNGTNQNDMKSDENPTDQLHFVNKNHGWDKVNHEWVGY